MPKHTLQSDEMASRKIKMAEQNDTMHRPVPTTSFEAKPHMKSDSKPYKASRDPSRPVWDNLETAGQKRRKDKRNKRK